MAEVAAPREMFGRILKMTHHHEGERCVRRGPKRAEIVTGRSFELLNNRF
jgi:hypothetical protein